MSEEHREAIIRTVVREPLVVVSCPRQGCEFRKVLRRPDDEVERRLTLNVYRVHEKIEHGVPAS